MSRSVAETWGEWASRHYTAEGERRGQLRAHRENLQYFLEMRFGPLPEVLRQRIEACEDVDRLQACLYQVLQMKSLEELQL